MQATVVLYIIALFMFFLISWAWYVLLVDIARRDTRPRRRDTNGALSAVVLLAMWVAFMAAAPSPPLASSLRTDFTYVATLLLVGLFASYVIRWMAHIWYEGIGNHAHNQRLAALYSAVALGAFWFLLGWIIVGLKRG